jgi:hypothetical protein
LRENFEVSTKLRTKSSNEIRECFAEDEQLPSAAASIDCAYFNAMWYTHHGISNLGSHSSVIARAIPNAEILSQFKHMLQRSSTRYRAKDGEINKALETIGVVVQLGLGF